MMITKSIVNNICFLNLLLETGNFAGEHDHFEIDLAMDSLSRVALMAYIEFNFRG